MSNRGPTITLWVSLVVVLILASLKESLGGGWAWAFLGFVGLCIGGGFWLKWWLRDVKRRDLMELYNDEEVVMRIMEGTVWQGETAEMLRTSLGDPEAIDDIVTKNVHRQVWKYERAGTNRFALRIELEHDVVTGWESKLGGGGKR